MYTIPIELKTYNRRADGSVSLRCESLVEVSSSDIASIDSYRGNTGFVVLTDSVVGNEVDFDVDEIIANLPENDTLDNRKSPSRRLRDIMWVVLKQKLGKEPSREEFADYYKREYEKLANHYKLKLDPDL
jgi:hypothetical protein